MSETDGVFEMVFADVLHRFLIPTETTPSTLGGRYYFDTIAHLRTNTRYEVNEVDATVRGYHSAGGVGGGDFVFVSSSNFVDDGGSVIRPDNIPVGRPGRWIRQFGANPVNVSMWGAKGNGVADDQPPIQKAIDFCSLSGKDTLVMNTGVFFLSSYAIHEYARDHLAIGHYPDSGLKINLKIVGGINTIITANNSKDDGGQYGLITLKENISTFEMRNITLFFDGVLVGDSYHHGLTVTGNRGSVISGFVSDYAIDRERIDIINCKFINCNRAITSGSSALAGRGTLNFNLINNYFLYPKGSDSTHLYGGGQVIFFSPDTLNLNIIGNYAEGTTSPYVNSPNGAAKDGFLFFAGIHTYIKGNTFARFAIETVYAGQSWGGFFLGDGDVLGENVVENFYNHYNKFNIISNVVRYATVVLYEGSNSKSHLYVHPRLENGLEFFIRKLKGETRSSLSEYFFRRESFLKYHFISYPSAFYSDDRAWIDFSANKPIYTINESIIYIRISNISISGMANNEVIKEAEFQYLKYFFCKKINMFSKIDRFFILNRMEDSFYYNNIKNIFLWFQLYISYLLNFDGIQFIKFNKRLITKIFINIKVKF